MAFCGCFQEFFEYVVHCFQEFFEYVVQCFQETSGNPHSSSGDDGIMATSLPLAAQMMPSMSRTLPLIPQENLRKFNLKQLDKATNEYPSYNRLGQGEFGYVTYGRIEDLSNSDDSIEVAVKKMYIRQNTHLNQRHKEWLAEVTILGRLSHRNVVKLIGYCREGLHRLLVYEYMLYRSLDKHLYSTSNIQDSSVSPTLPWATRVKVAHGVAMGLSYLHNQQPPVIHNDIKSSNILLDESYNAKLSDFGFAKEGNMPNQTKRGKHKSASISRNSKEASDVEKFGFVLLEILMGQKKFDKKRVKEVFKAHSKHADCDMVYDIVDKRLEGQYERKSVQKFAMLTASCIMNKWERPSMKSVVWTLEKILWALNESDDSNQFLRTHDHLFT